MFPLLHWLAGSCLLLGALVWVAGLLDSCLLIGRGAARGVGGLVLLMSSSPLAAIFRLLGFIPVGVGLVLGSASEPFVLPPLRIPIVHPSRLPLRRRGPLKASALRVFVEIRRRQAF
jgi:hypothetical protein